MLRTVKGRHHAIAFLPLLIIFGLAGSFGPAWAALPESRHEDETPLKRPPATVIQLTRAQLGSWRTAIEAAKGWDRIQKRAGNALDGLSPRVVPASLPGRGIFFRLWVGPVLKAGVGPFCARLRARHIDCVPAPKDAPVPAPGSGVYQASESP